MPLSSSSQVSTKSLSKDRRLAHFLPLEQLVWRTYVQGCARRNIAWLLPPNLFLTIIRSPCRYCGRISGNRIKNGSGFSLRYNGIDRIDNSHPYNAENSVPCCKICNSMKSQLHVEEFLNHIRLINRHISEQNFTSPSYTRGVPPKGGVGVVLVPSVAPKEKGFLLPGFG